MNFTTIRKVICWQSKDTIATINGVGWSHLSCPQLTPCFCQRWHPPSFSRPATLSNWTPFLQTGWRLNVFSRWGKARLSKENTADSSPPPRKNPAGSITELRFMQEFISGRQSQVGRPLSWRKECGMPWVYTGILLPQVGHLGVESIRDWDWRNGLVIYGHSAGWEKKQQDKAEQRHWQRKK